MVKKSAAGSCQGPSGMSLGNIGCIVCAALCLVHILQFFTYLAMSASIPWVRCCIFSTLL